MLADGSIRDTDGSVRTPAACNEPHYRFDGTRVEANGASFPAKIRVAPNVLDAEGKVALAFYRNTEPVTSVSTTWKVPPLPTNLSGPRLTYFSEAQLDVLSGVLPAIVRTVLQYNPPAPPTEPKPFWTIYTIATWQFVDPYISEAKRVDVGDTIVGTIKCANEKCSTWRATAEDTTKNIKSYQDYDVKDIGYPALKISQLNGGLLAESRGDPWNPIDTTCDQFPAGPYDFTPIEIKNTKGNTITPSWASYVANPICDFKISTYINPKTKDSDPTTSTISITH